jgi:DNA-binding response OmpR family regulator
MASFHCRLLVVDYEPSIRDLSQTSLSMEGSEVLVAKDGFETLAQKG